MPASPTSAEAAMLEQGAWQDIATAPKDGTPVLYISHAVIGGEDHYHASGICAWLEAPANDYFAQDGWWDICADQDAFHPTHWMPLPEPPGAGK